MYRCPQVVATEPNRVYWQLRELTVPDTMKVYLHFDGECKMKVKLPKKWPAEKDVTAIIEMFVENHNGKSPDNQLDATKVELVDKA